MYAVMYVLAMRAIYVLLNTIDEAFKPATSLILYSAATTTRIFVKAQSKSQHIFDKPSAMHIVVSVLLRLGLRLRQWVYEAVCGPILPYNTWTRS